MKKRVRRECTTYADPTNPSRTQAQSEQAPATDESGAGASIARGSLYLPLLIVVFGFLAYANTINAPFYFDDAPNIYGNQSIRISDIGVVSLLGVWNNSPNSKRPVANLSFALNYYFHQNAVTGYHVVNIVIHVINGILVYFLALITFSQVSRLKNSAAPKSGDPSLAWKSLFAAGVFTLHPLQTQAVTYIVQRMTSMSVMFYLLSMLLYVVGLRSHGRVRKWGLWAGCLASWILALGSKEIAATLPLMILLYRWYFFEDLSVKWLKRNAMYLVGLLILIAFVSFVYLGGGLWEELLRGYDRREFTIGERVLTQFRVVIFHISQLLFPHPSRLNLIHHIPTSRSLIEPISTLFALVGIAGLVWSAIRFRKQYRVLSFCVLWFLGNLAIESTVVPLEMIFEHRLYLPMFGFALMVSQLLWSSAPSRRWWSAGVGVLVIAVLAAATYQRNSIWRDPGTLWSDVISKNPQAHRAYTNLGAHYLSQGMLSEAAASYRHSLRIKPDYAIAYANLGDVLRKQGMLPEAADSYRHSLRLQPGDALTHLKFGDLLKEQGKFDRAKASYLRALLIDPNDAQSHFDVAVLAEPHTAIEHFREALRLDPNHASAANNLAWLLATSNDPQLRNAEEAVRWAQRAAEMTGDESPVVLDTLAAAYGAAGRFDRAVETAKKAIDLCVQSGQLETAREIRQRLRLYENDQPYRPVSQEPSH
jgi:tetratricopeptide (TPR) repeat protein